MPLTPLLTYVLGIDDLLLDVAVSYRLEHLQNPLMIGRAYDALPSGLRSLGDLRFQDPWLSAGHAQIDFSAHLIVDQNSRNGTYVNGEKIKSHQLADGDLIEMGRGLFCYRLVDVSAADAVRAPKHLGPTRTLCPEVAAVHERLSGLAAQQKKILLMADAGSGARTIAHAVHRLSASTGEFRPVDCEATGEQFWDLTLWGGRTGEGVAVPGELQRALGGTLYLSSLGALDSDRWMVLKNQLARVTNPSLRLIAACAPADAARFAVDFDEVLAMPATRARKEDWGALCAHLLRQAGVEHATFTAQAARLLFARSFPSNLHQLRAVLRQAAKRAGMKPIDVRHFPPLDRPIDEEPKSIRSLAREEVAPSGEEISRTLEVCAGNLMRAADILDISPRQLARLVHLFRVPTESFRARRLAPPL